MKRLFICMLSVVLGGCASAYIAPSSDVPTASISFEAKGDPALGFAAYLVKREAPADHSCMIKSQIMARIVEGNPILRSDNPENILIASGAEIGFRASFIPANLLGQYGCSYDINLKPESGKKYKVIIEWSRGGCNVNLESETSDACGAVSEAAETKRIGC